MFATILHLVQSFLYRSIECRSAHDCWTRVLSHNCKMVSYRCRKRFIDPSQVKCGLDPLELLGSISSKIGKNSFSVNTENQKTTH